MANEFIIIPESIDALVGLVDGYSEITHQVNVRATEYPVESGFIASDHAVVEPRRVKLTGWVSEITGGGVNAPEKAWTQIIKLARNRTLVRLATPVMVYENMLIEKAEAPLDETIGRSLRFEMELVEILGVDLSFNTGAQTDTADRLVDRQRGTIEGKPQ